MRSDNGLPPPVRVRGSGHETLLFLHGFMGRGDDWNTVIDRLASSFRCVDVDLPGHGGNAPLKRVPCWEDVADALDGIRSWLSPAPERWHLIGYSMGGRIALEYAVRHPGRTAGLIMVSASPGVEQEADRSARRERDREWAVRLQDNPVPQFLDAWYRQPVFSSLWSKPEMLADLIRRRADLDVEGLAQVLQRWGQGATPPRWDAVGSLPFPVAAVYGDEDPAYRNHAARMTDLSGNVTGVMVAGAGHTVPLEQPDVLVRIIENFIQNGAQT